MKEKSIEILSYGPIYNEKSIALNLLLYLGKNLY